MKDFSMYLEDNTKSLIKTGWPEYNFTDSVWIFSKLAPNYPIKMPTYIKNFHRFKNPHHDPYFFRMLFSRFSEKDLQMIEIIDHKYDQIKLFKYSLNGGLNRLIETIIFLYEECKFEKMTLEKNAMDSILEGSKLNHQGKFRSYYQLAQFIEDDYENKRFNKKKNKLDDELVKIEKEITRNKQFISETLELAKKECLNVSYLFKQKYYPFIDSLVKCFEEGESFEICMPFLKQYPTPSHKKFTPLKLPSGTKWEHVTR